VCGQHQDAVAQAHHWCFGPVYCGGEDGEQLPATFHVLVGARVGLGTVESGLAGVFPCAGRNGKVGVGLRSCVPIFSHPGAYLCSTAVCCTAGCCWRDFPGRDLGQQ
jgi:hypothetical protein